MSEPMQEMTIVDEIKDLERRLFIYRSKLKAAREQHDPPVRSLDRATWRNRLDEIRKTMKNKSTGGNAVEEIQQARNR